MSTFEAYLKEIKVKYAPGTPINSPKYGARLEGEVLLGRQILEVPDANLSSPNIQNYIDLAKNKYNIEIRFSSES